MGLGLARQRPLIVAGASQWPTVLFGRPMEKTCEGWDRPGFFGLWLAVIGLADTEWEGKCLQMRTKKLGLEFKGVSAGGWSGAGESRLQDWECSTTSAEVLLAFYKGMLIKD